MYKNKAIVNYSVNNNLWDKFYYGTELNLRAITFSDKDFKIQEIVRKVLKNYFTLKTLRSNEESMSLYNKEFTLKSLSEQYPDIVQLEDGSDLYLFDKKSNYFHSNYPHIDVDLARFCKSRDKFISNSNNGIFVLPADTLDEFINSVLDYTDRSQKYLFATELARFARGTAMRLQKIK